VQENFLEPISITGVEAPLGAIHPPDAQLPSGPALIGGAFFLLSKFSEVL
jgi:hypothetical protein